MESPSNLNLSDDPLLAAEAALGDEDMQTRPAQLLQQFETPQEQPAQTVDNNVSLFNQQQQQSAQETAPVEQPPAEQQQQESPEFVKQLQEMYGISPDDLKAGIEYIKQDMQVRQVQLIHNEMQKLWGINQTEFIQRMGLIEQEFNSLPENERAQFDSAQGAFALWDRIQRNQRAVGSYAGGSGTVPAGNPQVPYDYEESQIMAMSPEQRAREDKKILQAYAQGRVKIN